MIVSAEGRTIYLPWALLFWTATHRRSINVLSLSSLKTKVVLVSTALLLAGCGGRLGNGSGETPAATVYGLDRDRFAPIIATFGPHGNVGPLLRTPVRLTQPTAETLRGTLADVSTPVEVQAAGASFVPQDAQGYPMTEFMVDANASSTLQLPAPASGTNTVFDPQIKVGTNSCVALRVVYIRNAGDADTTRRLDVLDTCTDVEYAVATIDSTFQQTYEILTDPHNAYGYSFRAVALLNSAGTAWQVGLLNNATSKYDTLWTGTQLAATSVNGNAKMAINTFAVGACPNLPPLRVFGFAALSQLNPTPALSYLTLSEIAPEVTSGNASTPDCFSSAAAADPYYYQLEGVPPNAIGNGNAGFIIATEIAEPLPTQTPTAAPTATPTPVRGATPTPSATPTAVPRAIVVTQNQQIYGKIGLTTTIPCAFTVATNVSGPSMYLNASITAQNSGFPAFGSPVAAPLNWEVPDFSTSITPFANAPTMVGTIWSATSNESHCMTLVLKTPGFVTAGQYQFSLMWTLTQVSPIDGSTTTVGSTGYMLEYATISAQ